MCGIHGFNFADKKLAEAMVERCHHRGPDDRGVFVSPQMSLSHNRLAILDLSEKGHQPMWNEDHTRAIVFNGEIYNFQELREELKTRGFSFVSDSDTEVILAAYDEYGEKCVEKLNGIFAFAIWDTKRKTLFLARDHVGVKPLYYYHQGGKFIFSSEIKAILEHPDVPRFLHREAFNHYLRVLYVPEPLTMFAGIHRLPPGSFAVFRAGQLTVHSYWKPTFGDYLKSSREEIATELRGRIAAAVKRQLVSDRPLGLYLSGGIDSSVVLWSMRQARDKVDTFSVGFDLAEHEQSEKFNADFFLARRTAEQFETNHHEVMLSPHDVVENMEKAVWHMDEPISNPTALSMFKIASFSKPHADVVLTGDGGDELFGGYPRFQTSRRMSVYQHLPVFFRRLAAQLSRRAGLFDTPAGLPRYALFGFQKEKILRLVVRPEALDLEVTPRFFAEHFFSPEAVGNPEEQLMDVTFRSWLPAYALMLADKMSMSSSVEARVPLLDRGLVEFAYRIPPRYKVSFGDTKIILKEAFRGHVPEYLFDQPKRGWFSPGAKWLRYPGVHEFVREILSEKYYSETAELFDWPVLQKLLEEHRSREGYNLTILWAALTFQLWAKQYRVKIER